MNLCTLSLAINCLSLYVYKKPVPNPNQILSRTRITVYILRFGFN